MRDPECPTCKAVGVACMRHRDHTASWGPRPVVRMPTATVGRGGSDAYERQWGFADRTGSILGASRTD